jgi:hypothetical protein
MSKDPKVLRPDPGQIQAEPVPVEETPPLEETPPVEQPAEEKAKP